MRTPNDKIVDLLADMGACPEAVDWVRDECFQTLEKAWRRCPRADWLVWFATMALGHEVVHAHLDRLTELRGGGPKPDEVELELWEFRRSTNVYDRNELANWASDIADEMRLDPPEVRHRFHWPRILDALVAGDWELEREAAR